MHPLYGALPMAYVPVRVTRGTVIAHRYTYAPPRCRTSQYRRRESVDLLVTWHPSNSLITFAFWSSEVKRLLLDFDPYVALTPLVCLLFLRRKRLMFWLHVSVWCFDGFFVFIISLLAVDKPMSPQFQKVHRPPLLPITDQFP